MIEHIVLPGGGYLGLYELGVLKYLNKNNFYDISNIKTIHGTSVGALIGTMISLNIDWDTIYDYIIKRPWHKTANISPSMLFDVIPKKGLFSTKILRNIIIPLFHCIDIHTDITMKELYEHTNISLYLYTIDVNTFEIISLNHNDFPNLEVLKAIEMSCAIPYIFQPVEHNGDFYIDGGLLNNYPINDCLKLDGSNKENILSICLESDAINTVTIESNLLEFGYILYKKLIDKTKTERKEKDNILNEVIIPCIDMNMNDGYKTITDEKEREKYIYEGETFAKVFLSYKSNV